MNSVNKLTFRQREGIEPLPAPLEKENLSPKLRNAIWNIIYDDMRLKKGMMAEWSFILKEYDCDVLCFARDEWDFSDRGVSTRIKEIITQDEWSRVIEFLEFVAQNYQYDIILLDFDEYTQDYTTEPSGLSANFCQRINNILDKFLYPYRIVKYMFVPVSSKEEGEAIENAFTKLQENRLGGAEKHLTASIENLKQGKYPDSIRESIHAVESVASIIAGQKKAALRDALKVLKKKSVIEDSELTKSFEKLYDYTNDAKGGIRHALLSEESNVGADEAQFMLGACASFVSYLINKANKAEININ